MVYTKTDSFFRHNFLSKILKEKDKKKREIKHTLYRRSNVEI